MVLRWSMTAHTSNVFSWQNCFRSIDWKIILLLMRIHTPPPRDSLPQKLEASLYPSRENFIPYFSVHKTHFLFPEKCDLNSTWVLCAEGKYYFQTYKYLYIYYTTSSSWDSEICFQIMRSGITVCEWLTILSGDKP
jgi:hypothetical protein